MRRSARSGALAVASLLVVGCSSGTAAPDELVTPSSTTSADPTESGAATASAAPVAEAVEQDLELALSSPVEDSVYPDVGDPRVEGETGVGGRDLHRHGQRVDAGPPVDDAVALGVDGGEGDVLRQR